MNKKLYKSIAALFLSAILMLGNTPQVIAAGSYNDNGECYTNGNGYAKDNHNDYENGNGYEYCYITETDKDYDNYSYFEDKVKEDYEAPEVFFADGPEVVRVFSRHQLYTAINEASAGVPRIIELTNSFNGGVTGNQPAIVIAAGRDITLRSTEGNVFHYQRLMSPRHFTVNGTLRLENIRLQSGAAASGTVGGVVVNNNGRLYLEHGSEIYRNAARVILGVGLNAGGAIFISTGGTVVMNGGRIHGNFVECTTETAQSARNGGAIHVVLNGAFIMNGGLIDNNRANGNGGGVSIANGGTFVMNGGTITQNQAGAGMGANVNAIGGGVFVSDGGTFNQNGGSVIGNSAGPNNVLSDVWPITGPPIVEWTVIFDLSGGVLIYGELVQTVVDGEDATPPEVEKYNHDFIGWSPEYGYLEVSESKTITAMWDKEAVLEEARNALGYAIADAQKFLDGLAVCEYGDGLDINPNAVGLEWISRADYVRFSGYIKSAGELLISDYATAIREAISDLKEAWYEFEVVDRRINVFYLYKSEIRRAFDRNISAGSGFILAWTASIARNPLVDTNRPSRDEPLYALVQIYTGAGFLWILANVENNAVNFYTAGAVSEITVWILSGDDLPARDRYGSNGAWVGRGFLSVQAHG